MSPQNSQASFLYPHIIYRTLTSLGDCHITTFSVPMTIRSWINSMTTSKPLQAHGRVNVHCITILLSGCAICHLQVIQHQQESFGTGVKGSICSLSPQGQRARKLGCPMYYTHIVFMAYSSFFSLNLPCHHKYPT